MQDVRERGEREGTGKNLRTIERDDQGDTKGKIRVQASIAWEIIEERAKQVEKWGEERHTFSGWVAILGEEFGEVCKEVGDTMYSCYPDSNYRHELIQVAAVAMKMIEEYDRIISENQGPQPL